ncbi:MAG: ABC transporter permease subunit [Clostridia bacterium]|nr:ABC transporter permease subunit [Clostridia bacterium]
MQIINRGPNKSRMAQLGKKIWNFRWMYLFLLPAIVWYFLFSYMPIYGISIAFKKYNVVKGVFGSPWVGFTNFEKIFTDMNFARAFKNTLFISFLKMIFVTPIGLVLALLLNEVKSKALRGTVQSLSMLTHFLSWVVIASIMKVLLSPTSGIVNKVIVMCGGAPIYFLASKDWFIFWVVVSDMWESAGWNALIFIAAIAGISPDIYDAADIDGAGRWVKMFRITIPCLRNTISTVLILKLGGLLSGNFNQIFNLYNNAVMDAADILDTYVYRLGINNMQFSYSSAVNLFQNVIGLALVTVANLLVKKLSDSEEGILG